MLMFKLIVKTRLEQQQKHYFPIEMNYRESLVIYCVIWAFY